MACVTTHRSDYDVFVDYVENNSPIDIEVEGRVVIVYGGDSGVDSGSGSGPGLKISSLLLMTIIFFWKVL